MDRTRFFADRLRWRVQTLAYAVGSAALLVVAAWIVLGAVGALWLLSIGAAVIAFQGQLPVHTILRMRGARPFAPFEAPVLHSVVAELARRAHLERVPTLYFVPRREPQAFTVASGRDAVIAVSRGLLDLLDSEELAAVLAHEVSHVRAKDTRLLAFMQAMRQLTGSIVLFGLVAVLLSVVGLFPAVSPLVPLLLVVPGISMAATMAVSRTREFDADLGAAALVGDPRPLARALVKLERFHRRLLGFVGAPLETLVPRSLQTHPPTRERVARLVELVSTPTGPAMKPRPQTAYPPVTRRHFVVPSRLPSHSRYSPRSVSREPRSSGTPPRWVAL